MPGFRAVLAYALGTVFFFYAFVQRVSPSVMTTELMRDFAIGGAGIGLLSSMYFYTYAAMQLPVGLLVDRLGARKLMSAALLICAMASLVFSFSDSLVSASVSRAIIGATVAFAFVGTLSIASMFFPASRFALLAGILLGVGMIGGMAGQAPLRLAVEAQGWRTIFVALALIALLLALLIYSAVPKRPQKDTHDEAGRVSMTVSLQSVLLNAQSWWCAWAGFGLSATMLSFAGLWAIPWLTSTRDLSNTQAATITSLMFLGWAIGSPTMGWVSDAVGRRKPVLVVGAVVSLISLLFILYSHQQSVFILSVLFFINGLGSCTMIVCFGLVRELNKPAYTATAIGLTNMWVVGAGAVMQPLLGWLLDRRWSGEVVRGARIYSADAYSAALSSLVVVVVIALLASLLVRETHCQQQVD